MRRVLVTGALGSVEHVVFLSVAGAERNECVPHRKVERHLLERHAARGWTILRPGFFAQNLRDAYLRDVVDDDRIYVPPDTGAWRSSMYATSPRWPRWCSHHPARTAARA